MSILSKLPSLPSWVPAWSTAKGYVLGALAAIALCLPLGYCTGLDHGKKAQIAAQAKAERKARDLQEQSAGVAAGEQITNDQNIDEAQARRDKEIRDAGEAGQKPSAGRNAVNCDRLRRAGKPTEHIPACAAGEGGTGAATGR